MPIPPNVTYPPADIPMFLFSPVFDEHCFIIGSAENLSATVACECAKTYLSGDEVDATFALIEHQIMLAGCIEAAARLIQRASEK